jgi:hypothetical protein
MEAVTIMKTTNARPWAALLSLAGAALLAGCSGMRIVDSDVNAYSTLSAVPAGATYRFERLPSQERAGEPQSRIESMAAQSLARVGLTRNDASPRYSVLVGARVQATDRDPWGSAWQPWGFMSHQPVVTRSGQVVYVPVFPSGGPPLPWYEREVSIVMRDIATGQVVYETRAEHSGRWSDNAAVLPVMFDAALRNFPAATPGPQRVAIEIPR